MKIKLLFVITQFYKGGAETSLLNLFHLLNPEQYEVDFLVLNQIEYKDATSLMKEVPEWIQVFDVVRDSGKGAFLELFLGKVYRRLFRTQTYVTSAKKFVKCKEYDVAISFGEWLSPLFVAKKVKAKQKYVWIHIDLDKANFVNRGELVKYNKRISGYIFASEKSRQSSVKECPQMASKSTVVHNFLNKKKILEKSEEKIQLLQYDTPYLVSVGNLRVEKNYPRQIEIMRLLKERKIPVKWLCVGSTVDKSVYDKVKKLIGDYQLEDDFILYGADDNPYKYMKQAKAVMVLSDYESWSLVISEAKVLGIPVIATETSGAQEQLIDKKTGILTTFDPYEIADKIAEFLNDPILQKDIRRNLEKEETYKLGLQEFENLIGKSVYEKGIIHYR